VSSRQCSDCGGVARPVGPFVIALAATVATIATLWPNGCGPGVTCDEAYHVAKGKGLVTTFLQQGLAFFTPGNVRQNFYWPDDGPPVQAPLGHWILGWTHHLFDPAPGNRSLIVIQVARFAPAVAFGLLVFLIGLWTMRNESHLAGTVAAAATALVPRLFAHAHLAALDMLTTLLFVAAVLAVTKAVRGGRWWHFALAGVVWGLAMLVRLHGLLVLPPVIVWLIWRLRQGSILALVSWLAAGMATFFVGWPWLWTAPIGHFWRYLSSGAGRETIDVFYLGRVWADREVPWHYPLVMFAVALPLGLLLLGAVGVWAKRRCWRAQPELALPAATLVFTLLVFAWPGVPVYDGVRLFLMAFPLWSIWVGIGAGWLVEHPAMPWLSHRVRVTALGLFLLIQGVGVLLYHPCQLSHYSLLVGGLAGAERLGFEVSYWGDAVREPMLGEATRRSGGGPLLFGPSLADFQVVGVAVSSPALMEGQVPLVGWNPRRPEPAADCRWAVVYHRRANLAAVDWILAQGRVVGQYGKQGVWLARLVELPRSPRRARTED